MEINGTNLRGLNTGYRVLHNQAMAGYTPTAGSLAMETQSDAASEVYAWLGSFPAMREKTTGQPDVKNLASSTWQMFNQKYHNTVGVPKETVERDKYGQYNQIMGTNGLRAAQHADFLLKTLLLDGFTEVDYTGAAFFHTAKTHVKGKKGANNTFSNKLTKQLTAAYFSDARRMLVGMLDPEGYPLNAGAELVLITSPELTPDALKICEATLSGGAGDTNIWKGRVSHLEFAFLGDSPKWFLANLNSPMKPFINQIEKRTTFTSMVDPDNAHTFLNDEFLYKSEGRYVLSYGLPQLIVGSTGADA